MSSCLPSDPSGPPTPALPVRAGVGLKSQHFQTILATRPDIGFFEVHAENFMVPGGPFHHYLTRIRERHALSVHGVALSIGADAPLDRDHLDALKTLLARYQPHSFSEHLAWSTHGDTYLNDLLPLPYNASTLQRVCDHIDQVQTHLQRRMLLENPATYVEFAHSSMDEAGFLGEVVRRTGCGLLLDVNNAYVCSINHHRDAQAYIRALPLQQVGEIHLAGFARQHDSLGDALLVDDHGSPVAQAVWDLYALTLHLTGPVPTLIERDNNLPEWPVLLAEARLADQLLRQASRSSCRAPAAVPREAVA
ncbi:DUF692 domain-containing protein [Rhodoferax sp.]|uniref:MNIO family bufferin maturase n=1 Tax=Rhodoferax sp. TaxID=50421 RepID=UPI002614CFB7|nr:DUF692 domain-containing protein [Rhodoferax sp.]MDD2926015.1 DUF692 domain-containing protein [Rhodoferax sp.]